MSTRASSHQVPASFTHRFAGARAPVRLCAKNLACSPPMPCWRAQTVALEAALPSTTTLADACRTRAHHAVTPALDSNPHSAVPPLAPEPMARGFLPLGLSDAYRQLR